jgi:hypothetical protein
MIVMLSQTGTCYIGAHYDTASINDHELFARCLRDGFAEVLALAPQPEPVPGADRPSPAVPPVPATDPVTRELVSAAATLSPAVKARPNGKRPRAREVVAAGTR